MSNIVPIGQARAPAAMRNRLQAGSALTSNFADGVRDSFPILSVKGKVFRIRMNGQETPLIDQQSRQAIPYLDVIMLNASRSLSKTYYVKGFEEGSFEPPDCWSLDSIRPDPSVPNKVNPTCQDCPMNIFGSAPARDQNSGKRGGKACQDNRRVAVMMPGHLDQEEPLVFMMRVPATSLKNLKAYAQLLERQGWEPAGCVTRLAFDYNEAYPKLVFNFVDGIDDVEYDRVVQIAEAPATAAMLAAPDFDQAVSTGPTQQPQTEKRVRQTAPIMEDPTIAEKPKDDTAVPPLKGVDTEVWVDLPTGESYNPVTGEIRKPDLKTTKAPAVDPDVLPLPDGRFFNKKTQSFVVSQEVGAASVETPAAEAPGEVPAKPKRTRGPNKPKQEAAPPVENVEDGDKPEEEKPNGHAAKVQSAPAALDDIIKSVFPTKK